MKHLGSTPPFRRPSGEVVPGSIAEVNYLRLGGLDQLMGDSASDQVGCPHMVTSR
jgi:hypothetical protein